jgi:TRAP-type uncharacterized transport system fused permease subunit
MYMTLEGIFGIAVDVSATLIILFTIYGAFLQYSGAGKFFLDFSFSLLGGKTTSAGAPVVLASFLLGGPSGSGVATTVTIEQRRLPDAREGGYEKAAAGGLLAAGGLGGDPVAAGARRRGIPHRRVPQDLVTSTWIKMAVIPTILYYFSLFLMVELDARKYGMSRPPSSRWKARGRSRSATWYHFLSLSSIVIFMLMGYSPTVSVFWATVTASR